MRQIRLIAWGEKVRAGDDDKALEFDWALTGCRGKNTRVITQGNGTLLGQSCESKIPGEEKRTESAAKTATEKRKNWTGKEGG